MCDKRHAFARLLTALCAAVLLFVVLFPYTPTPIATTIGKILVSAILVLAAVAISLVVAVSYKVFAFSSSTAAIAPNYDLLDLICTRLR